MDRKQALEALTKRIDEVLPEVKLATFIVSGTLTPDGRRWLSQLKYRKGLKLVALLEAGGYIDPVSLSLEQKLYSDSGCTVSTLQI